MSDVANKDTIVKILQYHVLSGESKAADIPTASNTSQPTLLTGENLFLTKNDAGVFVNGVQVTQADVDADNGVIHVIGTALRIPKMNVVASVTEDSDLDILETAIGYVDAADAGIGTLLSGAGPFTVFAPTNQAFLDAFDGANGTAPNGTIETAELDILGADSVAKILRNHVVSTRAFASDLSDGQTLTSAFGEDLDVSIDGATVTIDTDGIGDGATVTMANLFSRNGVVHKIDKVLLPTPSPSTTIVGIAQGNADLSLLVTAVITAGLAETLSEVTENGYTVFAPTNDAFTNAGFDETFLSDAANADAIRNILLYHTISSEIKAADVPAGPNEAVATVQGEDVYVTNNNAGVFINGVQVVTADVDASNGVVHVIGSVLNVPKETVVTEVSEDNDLSALLLAIQFVDTASTANSPGLATALSGNGPFTVFAPTNAAFLSLDQNADNTIDIEDLRILGGATVVAVLRNHVVSGRIFSSDLTDNQMVSTLETTTSEMLTIGVDMGAVTVSSDGTMDANVIMANITTQNGVLHKIDKVLMP